MNSTKPTTVEDTDIHKIVRNAYAQRVTGDTKGCSASPSCCTTVPSANITRAAEKMGYTKEDVQQAPDESNLGLGCGAPLKPAQVKRGDTVLDLGSGAGFDAFLAVHEVGPEGKVIGVDMTLEMVDKAKANAAKSDYSNVDFRLGKIEALPIESNSIDVVISNCVVNLSPDKPAVFREAHRVLKPGGRIAVSDICLTQPLPKSVQMNLAAYVGCIAGASVLEDYVGTMLKAGFVGVDITTRHAFDVLACDDPLVLAVVEGLDEEDDIDLENLKNTIVSATVVAYKT